MVRKKAVIKNKAGIHVRPTGVIINSVKNINASIVVRAKGMESDLKDHVSLLAMGLLQGDTVEIIVSGDNEEEVGEKIKELFEKKYDFPPRSEVQP
ncbi:MAG: hypothetical protein DRP87_11735 [Spirochaetes bacterium]|nr:MAG: hypothetical protein DRP87_11735 [Spirochaetota bacterium]